MVDRQVYDPDDVSILDFLPEFFEAFEERMKMDDERWGNVWLQRPILEDQKHADQDNRIYARFDAYWEKFKEDDLMIDQETWLKIIGNSFIAWVRLTHPELFPFGLTDKKYAEE